MRLAVDKPFTGDFDEMVKRRAIRVGVTFNRTHYFIDQGQERGLTYEALKSFESDLNTDLKTGNLKVHVVIVPMSRDLLAPSLLKGTVDMIAAMVTVRPELEAIAAFSEPTRTNVSQVVVTGPGAPTIASADDLSGQEVFVRKASAYYDTLSKLNAQLKARGKPAVVINEAPDVLEDDDVLEMVNAGLAPITVVDDYLAEFWSQVFTGITVRKDLALRTGGRLAVAFRKDNPRLREAVNEWIRKHGKGDGFRNVIERRYLQSLTYVKNAAADAERQKLAAVGEIFKKYGAEYKVDYLLMAAQGYQESTLDQNVKSRVGAVGVMQVMPPTGKELNVGNIAEIEPNIHAGVKYMRFMMDRYFKDEPMDDLNKMLMTFASYNAGPGRVRQLRRETASSEASIPISGSTTSNASPRSESAARRSPTSATFTSTYITYRLVSDQRDRREAAKAAIKRQATSLDDANVQFTMAVE